MRLALYAMEEILVNVPPVSMVIGKERVMAVVHAMISVQHASEVPIRNATNATKTISYNHTANVMQHVLIANLEIQKLRLVMIVMRHVLYAMEEILWNAQLVYRAIIHQRMLMDASSVKTDALPAQDQLILNAQHVIQASSCQK